MTRRQAAQTLLLPFLANRALAENVDGVELLKQRVNQVPPTLNPQIYRAIVEKEGKAIRGFTVNTYERIVAATPPEDSTSVKKAETAWSHAQEYLAPLEDRLLLDNIGWEPVRSKPGSIADMNGQGYVANQFTIQGIISYRTHEGNTGQVGLGTPKQMQDSLYQVGDNWFVGLSEGDHLSMRAIAVGMSTSFREIAEKARKSVMINTGHAMVAQVITGQVFAYLIENDRRSESGETPIGEDEFLHHVKTGAPQVLPYTQKLLWKSEMEAVRNGKPLNVIEDCIRNPTSFLYDIEATTAPRRA